MMTVATRSGVCIVFCRLDTEIVNSNATWCVNVCLCSFCVSCFPVQLRRLICFFKVSDQMSHQIFRIGLRPHFSVIAIAQMNRSGMSRFDRWTILTMLSLCRLYAYRLPILVAAQFKAWDRSRSLAGTAGSNPTCVMDVCLL